MELKMPRTKILNGKVVELTSEEESLRDAEEAKAEADRLEYQKIKYKDDRKFEYPSIEDCIHALLDGGDTLTELQAKRTAIKEKYPKPT